MPCVVTVNDLTREEGFREAVLVVSDLGEPNAPCQVLSDPRSVSSGGMVDLATLTRIAKG
jgi:hypothetical protein